MEFVLPSFPTTQGASSSMFGLPTFSQSPVQQQQLPLVPETPKIEPVFALSAKMQFISTSESGGTKRDKEGSLKIWSEGPSVEILIKKKTNKQSIENAQLQISDGTANIAGDGWLLKIWANGNDFYQLIASFYIAKRNAKSKGSVAINEGEGIKVCENDDYSGFYYKWKIGKNGTLQGNNESQVFTSKNATQAIQSAVHGHSSGARILIWKQKSAILIELKSVEKFVRKIPTTNVADRLAHLEYNADLLIAKAEQYVKYKNMQRALTKLKQRSQELDLMIDSNSIMTENLKLESEDNQANLAKTKNSINSAAADQKTAEEKALSERASLLATINGIDKMSCEMELSSLAYEGIKAKFAKCVSSMFGAVCSGLGDGQDFSGAALTTRLEAIQRLVAESIYL